MSMILNVIQHPRSTILGLIGSTGGGAAVIFLADAMHCDVTQLSWETLSTVMALISAPAVVGAGMRDTKPTLLMTPEEASHVGPTT